MKTTLAEIKKTNAEKLNQHTPCKLIASGACGMYYVRDEAGGIVFQTGGNFNNQPFTEDEACSNARELVARWNSQPELLAALEMALGYVECDDLKGAHFMLSTKLAAEQIRAAIAKAKGVK